MDDSENIYDRLRKKLSNWPVKLPRNEEITAILKLLFKPEEVDLLLSMSLNIPYIDRTTIKELSEELNKTENDIEQKMNTLSDRGLVIKYLDSRDGNTYYSLMPVLPGFFEAYIIGEKDNDKRKLFSELFEKYYTSKLASEIGSSNYPWVRVLPSEKHLDVNIDLDPKAEILSFETVSEYIKTSRKIAIMDCACRTKSRCEHPLKTCFCFDNYAEFMVNRGLAKELNVDDAVNFLTDFEKHGLVHTSTNCGSRPQFICNCCSCSCILLRGLSEFKNPRTLSKSNFQPFLNMDECNLCGVCVDICPMQAIDDISAENNRKTDLTGQLVFDKNSCIGCGLCASNCPQDAITLMKIRNVVPESKPGEMWKRTESERISP